MTIEALKTPIKALSVALMVAAMTVGLLAAVSASPASASVPAPSATSPPAAARAAIVPSTVQYITKDFFGTTEGQKVLRTVACPTGTFVVSSGAGDGIIKSIAPLRSLNAPQKLANFTAVGVTAVLSNPFFPAGRLRIVVGCAPASQLANATTQSTVLPPARPFSQRRAEVRCPLLADGTATHAFGGGGHFLTIDGHYSTASDFMRTNTVTADGRGWVYQGATESPNEKLIVTTQCAPMPDSRVASSSITALGGLTDPLAVCPSGFTDISGGVEGGNAWVLHSMTAFFGGWFVRSNPFVTQVVTARAQCVPNV
jgi:hypothetical protein